MESFLGIIGLLFFMFLVLSAAVEVILESLRGMLELFGLTWLKSNVSLDNAIALSKEFAPGNAQLQAKIEALTTTAKQLGNRASDKIEALKRIKANLNTAGAESIIEEINERVAAIKTDLDQRERRRVFIVRLLAAVIGCCLIGVSEFHVFEMLAKTPELKELVSGGTMKVLVNDNFNIFVGGLAAAAGSSYWHDQLDKVRALKSAAGNLKTLES